MWYLLNMLTNKLKLTVIGRATEYVHEYIKSGFQQATAYSVVFNCERANAVAHASTYHKSPAVQDAFANLIGASIHEYYRSRDGITLKAQEIYDSCQDNNTRLKCLRFISELAGYLDTRAQVTIDQRTIQVLTPEIRLAIQADIKRNKALDK